MQLTQQKLGQTLTFTVITSLGAQNCFNKNQVEAYLKKTFL